MAPAALTASLLALSAASGAQAAFECYTDVKFGPVASNDKKGFALDDSTLRGCPAKIPAAWPNAEASVKSLRLFKAWDPVWPDEDRLPTWEAIASFAHDQQAKILVGTQITCDPEQDDQDWVWVKQLLGMLDKDHIMGVAIGNELDILFQKNGVAPDCIQKLWPGERLWTVFQKRVADLNALGFSAVPITSVFTSAVLGGAPFIDEPTRMVNTFLKKAVTNYTSRFVFSFNFYPYFDPNFQLDAGTTDQCTKALKVATCFSGGCSVPNIVGSVKGAMQQISSTKHKLWIGETGWSAPLSDSLAKTGNAMAKCKAWSSDSALTSAYSNFLDWNLEAGGVDHAFYFTVRDSMNFGVPENFGLIAKCWSTKCKLRSANYTGPSQAEVDAKKEEERLYWLSQVWLGIGAGAVALTLLCGACRWCSKPKRVDQDNLTDAVAASA